MDTPVTSAPAADKLPEQTAINMDNEGNGENELFGTPNVRISDVKITIISGYTHWYIFSIYA